MTAASRIGKVTAALGGRLAFRGDYNPEQWPAETVSEDVAPSCNRPASTW